MVIEKDYWLEIMLDFLWVLLKDDWMATQWVYWLVI